MNNAFSKRLADFATPPPPRAWDAIAAALDEDTVRTSERLEAFSAPAPPETWARIAAQLDTTKSATVVPFTRRWSRMYRYAGATAAVLLFAFLINMFFRKEVESGPIASQHPVQQPTNQLTDSGTSTTTSSGSGNPQLTTTVSTGTDAAALARTTRYVAMEDDKGQMVRVSKKVAPVINCAERTDAKKWSRCKERIEAMQAKMASSMATPSADFAGLIDMIKSLEENR